MATKNSGKSSKSGPKGWNKENGAFVPVNLKDIQFVNKPTKSSKKSK